MRSFSIAKIAITMFVLAAAISSVTYKEESLKINAKPENLYVLDLNMNNPLVELNNKLSFDKLYGFESLSDMAGDADYAINGMFYDPLGIPLGTIIEDGKIIHMSRLNKPKVLIDKDNKVHLDDVEFEISIKVKGKEFSVKNVNGVIYAGEFGLYDSYYGSSTRIRELSTNYIIENGLVSEIIISESPVKIPKEDGKFILAIRGRNNDFSKGDKIEIIPKNTLGIGVKTGFTLGAWLVKDGKNVAQRVDDFIGPTDSLQPRTIVGITKDNHLIFVLIDGRTRKSMGVTGKECADILIDYGVTYGGYLDGGASSEIIVDGEIKNNIAGKNERKIAHCIVIKEKNK